MTERLKFLLTIIFIASVTFCTAWLGSGSISPYASSHHTNIVGECGYLYNIDHSNFVGTYLLLDGQPKNLWEGSVVLRRLLYPLLSYPFMKYWGFNIGGVIASFLINILASIALFIYLNKKFGLLSARVGSGLLLFYPGITYWAGLPYSYCVITPVTIGSFIAMDYLSENITLYRGALVSFFIGVLSTGYDILPFYLPALVLLLFFSKRKLLIAPSLALLVLPSIIVSSYLKFVHGAVLLNSNSNIYGTIINAFLSPQTDWLAQWYQLLSSLPNIFLQNFFYGNFFFLPTAFLLTYFTARSDGRFRFTRVELAVLGSTFLVWLFNNSAPPYPGWQMRGVWIARLYQPIFIVFIMYIARVVGLLQKDGKRLRLVAVYTFGCIFGQAAVVLTPLLGWYELTGKLYYEFYHHSSPRAFSDNMLKYGVRPLGFCSDKDVLK